MVYYDPHFKDKKTEAGGALPKVTQVASIGGGACIQFYLVPKPMLLTTVHMSPQDVRGAHLKGKASNKQEAGCHCEKFPSPGRFTGRPHRAHC